MKKLKFLLSTSLLLMLCLMFAACSSDLDPDDDIIQEPTGIVQGHEYVDLGLSVYWATCNVGADSPEDYGDYYAWGETTAKSYSSYKWESYKWCKGTESSLTKYCTDINFGTMDNRTILTSSDDVATVKWGGKWRMPTEEEFKELLEYCTWEYTTRNGVDGMKVIGPNGNFIFLPSAGTPLNGGGKGKYWTNTLYEAIPYTAYSLEFFDPFVSGHDDYLKLRVYQRLFCFPVRPVTKNVDVENSPDNELKNIIAGDWYAFAYDERFVDVVSFSEDGSYKAHEYNAEGNVTVDDNGNVDADWIRDYGKFNGSWKITGDNLFLQEDGKGGRDGNSYSCLVEINPGKIQSVEENKFVVKYIIKAKDMNGEVLEFEYLTTFIRLGSSGSNDENEKPEESDKTTGEIQGHEWVDLGLSVKWATCNVGAESPEEYGGCYTWSSTDDIATKKWGSKWRMPTKEEFEELSEDCTWKWTTKDGVNGYEVKGDNGNSIFLPAAGYYYGSSRQEDGETGYYWSSTPYQNNSRAYGIDFNEEGRNIYRYALSYEQSVRPVCE